MSDVDRYFFNEDGEPVCHHYGQWVLHDDHVADRAKIRAELELHAVSMMKRKDAALRDWQDERDAAERLRARLGEVEAEVARLRGLLRSLQRRFVDPATHPTTYAEIEKEVTRGA